MAVPSRQLRLAMLCVFAGVGILWLRFWVGYTPYVRHTPVPTSAPTSVHVHSRGWIAAADYGARWPFTVDAGQLQCFPGQKVVFTMGDITYAVNGVAKDDKRFPPFDPIWRKTKTRSALSEIIQKGLAMC